MTATAERLTADIGIAGMTVRLRVPDEAFLRMVQGRYAGFPGAAAAAECDFDVELVPQRAVDDAALWMRIPRTMMCECGARAACGT